MSEERITPVLTIDELKLWSQHALKVFLNVRGKDTTGSFEELVAR